MFLKRITPLRTAGLALLVVAALGAARVANNAPNSGSAANDTYKSVLIENVPHVQQKPDFCGEACTAMMLQRLGQKVDQDYVFDQSGLDPLAARGCFTKELAAALKKIGFRIGDVWYTVPTATAKAGLEAQWKALHTDLLAGHGSIICMRTSNGPGATEHFRLVLGYDAATDQVIYHEPAERDGAYRRMPRATLMDCWPLKYSAKQWTVIRIPLVPGRLRPGRTATTFTAADYAQHLMDLKKKVPGEGFTIIIQHPFVVIGDEPPDMVRRRSLGTVKWAVDKLKKSYFKKDPNEILDIWLFRDKDSYEKHTRSIFNTVPSTPYGYFSHTDRALVMNIATGGGTLVHEIVHPFVASNFPECPSWFNEGLGSLYEQSSERNGRIRGLTNWRLAGLQRAIRQEAVPSFQTLCSTTTRQFYDADPGTNYAQARYLCYYLQEKGLLEKFYHRFHAQHTTDPTGYKTLQEVLGQTDMDAFKKEWEKYVLGLRFP
ncbi:MAG: C39 family peptidase [Pirellulales bacterium]|nr:C39 family peptidase [Pirellulales bacterium]